MLFDGEEPAAGLPEEQSNFYATGLRGSRAYARAQRALDQAMVLLDYVGNKGLRLPREGTSTLALWARLRSAARAAGVSAVFPDARRHRDHRRPHAVPEGRGARRST